MSTPLDFKYLASKDFITVTLPDENGVVITRTLLSSDTGFSTLADGIAKKTLTREQALEIVAPERRIKKAVEKLSDSNVSYDAATGNFFYQTYPIDASMQIRLEAAVTHGLDPKRVVNFLEKLYANPNPDVVARLYTFIEKSNLPITENGDFIAYKVVKANYMDIHSGSISNAIGERPTVDRKYVDSNNEQTCSRGLHVCSKSYLPHFGAWREGSNRVVLCVVSPTDVCAIPRDYNDAKMRTCGYLVIGEIANEEATKIMELPQTGGGFPSSIKNNEAFSFGEDADDHFDSSDYYDECDDNPDDAPVYFGHSQSVDTTEDDSEEEELAKVIPDLYVLTNLYTFEDEDDMEFTPATYRELRNGAQLYRLNKKTNRYDEF